MTSTERGFVRMIERVMADKPSALRDVRQGLGLLFRAAKTVAEKLPGRSVEEVVANSAREVGRAFENVATTIEREVFGRRAGSDGSKDEVKPDGEGEPTKDADKPKKPADG
jgi:hypothetical protein